MVGSHASRGRRLTHTPSPDAGVAVCASPTCSLFYAKRFCVPCTHDHRAAFPVEVQRDIDRAQAKAAAQATDADARI